MHYLVSKSVARGPKLVRVPMYSAVSVLEHTATTVHGLQSS